MTLVLRMLACACLGFIAAPSARSAEPESFPVPTLEEREKLRKAHLRLGGMNAPLTQAQAPSPPPRTTWTSSTISSSSNSSPRPAA